ncbi:uncharacterized protein LOC111356338 [Spodoptera litura]|uniref:Uncharacterized protein LOC111356338 n=1 Tax=Spodoptera litura TaxID=69820 RepID=A0A9J7E8Z0_SPOLT|nr:uncharacterized protein LOC111356338 [Spodoptera litura]
MSIRRNRPLINERVKRMLQMVEDTVITNTDCDIIAVDPESSVKETFSNQVLSKYELRDKTNKKYFDTDQESDEDFSPDVSEYAPSPSSNIFKSPLSSVSSLSPDETLEINHNETLTGRTSNDCSHAREVVTDNEDSPSLIRKICSEEENNETLRPEEQSESNNDTTLTGRTSSDCEHMEAVENEKKTD